MKLFIGSCKLQYTNPTQDYGGMWAVVAKTFEQCVEILTTEFDTHDPQAIKDIEQAVDRSQKFDLEIGYTSGVIKTYFN
jgi:hypothetical protein